LNTVDRTRLREGMQPVISQQLRHTCVVIVVMVKLKHFLWVKAYRFQDRLHVKV